MDSISTKLPFQNRFISKEKIKMLHYTKQLKTLPRLEVALFTESKEIIRYLETHLVSLCFNINLLPKSSHYDSYLCGMGIDLIIIDNIDKNFNHQISKIKREMHVPVYVIKHKGALHDIIPLENHINQLSYSSHPTA